MNRTMITATNTMSQLQLQMDLIGNNLANVDTTGYKRKEGTFNDLLVQQVNNQRDSADAIGRLTPQGIRQGVGAKISLVKLILTQGALKNTERDLDVALTKPDLFFKVQTTDASGTTEMRFTRDGSFYLSPSASDANQLELVTSSGNRILDQWNNPISITGDIDSITISENGTLVATKNDGQQQTIELGVISVQNPQYLENKGGNLYGLTNEAIAGVQQEDVYTDLIGGLRENVAVQQGSLENSNVDMSKEMTDLITAQRMYQFQARSVTLADQMLGLVNGLR
ncbi:flagellar hook-basal body protein [Bacillus sp. AGMB 02131]|uniref:Flagellar hook-basal body protein n=1 Tax=Peribacillus faecalis TaxID=2772559 RepID=A0A927CYT8_9BACI|nr:flagellar hook-basal body protein [Peribacillus faecalis]MBD3110207.1 flagellar hook-basal body protein [Peribacillus faecalis]